MLNQKSKQLNKTTKEFRKYFILQFTKELIKNSGSTEILELANLLKDEQQQTKDKVKQIVRIKREIPRIPILQPKLTPSIMQKTTSLQQQEQPSLAPIVKTDERMLSPRQQPRQKILRIPRPRTPSRFEYLKPMPTKKQIDLGKLNPLVTDPVISFIECNGADENIIVKGSMGMKKTNIRLTKEDIKEVINKFSEKTKIPVQEGVFKVAIGTLIFTAIISEVVSSRFIIQKMKYNLQPPIFRR